MGPRARLDQLQGRANALMAKAEWELADVAAGIKLIFEMIKDGVAVNLFVEKGWLLTLGKMAIGGGGMLPIKPVFDLTYSKEPPSTDVEYKGGSLDGKVFKTQHPNSVGKHVLKYPNGEIYAWNGWVFELQEQAEAEVPV